MLNKLREKLNEGKATVNTRIWSTWPTIVEAAASTGNFDYFEFLAEYAPFSFNDLENFVRTCELYNTDGLCGHEPQPCKSFYDRKERGNGQH